MNSREFHASLREFIQTKSSEWSFFGNKHKQPNELDDEDIKILIAAVKVYQPTTLGLANIGIDDHQITLIAHALQNNTTLQLLYLPFNHITDKGAAAIADLLSKETNISRLVLFNNKIGNFGMAALANMLYSNHSLKKLELFCNEFTEKAAEYFYAPLSYNTWINTLLLYPAKSGIHLKPVEISQEERRQQMIRFFTNLRRNTDKSQQLKKMASITSESTDGVRPLMTKAKNT